MNNPCNSATSQSWPFQQPAALVIADRFHLDSRSCCHPTYGQFWHDQNLLDPVLLPSNFYNPVAAVPRVRVLSPLFGFPTLCSRIGLRKSAYIKTPALSILDRYAPRALPDCPAVV